MGDPKAFLNIPRHERLSIVDPQSGGQPLYSPDRKLVLAVNGEIYNHRDIRARYAGRYEFQTGSDCEVILALYRDKGIRFLEDLNGIFAFALYDFEEPFADGFDVVLFCCGIIELDIFTGNELVENGKGHVGVQCAGSEAKQQGCMHHFAYLAAFYYQSSLDTFAH